MRKTKATKKSGTIAYQLSPRFDLQGEATEKNPLMGVSIVPMPPVTTREMAERIGYATSVNKTDVIAVLHALGYELSEALLDGRTVQIDEIGSFGVKLGLKERKGTKLTVSSGMNHTAGGKKRLHVPMMRKAL